MVFKNKKVFDYFAEKIRIQGILLADKQSKVIFGGWLGEYKYYDMSQVFEVSLERCRVSLE